MNIGGDIAGIASGLMNQGVVSAPDLSELFRTIDNAGENQRALISALPADLQKQYADYKASNAATGTALQSGTNQLAQNLQTQTEANFDPNAPAVKAAEDQAKTAIYADLPGQQAAIREALAATGGFDRGTASKQLAAPVIQAGAKYAQAVSGITTQQLQAKQQATQQALQTVTAMNDQVLQQLFGMNKEQALNILNSNRQDLKDQLTSLINQSQTQTQQKLGVQGADITNKYNEAIAQKAQSDALNNSYASVGGNVINSIPFVAAANTVGSFSQSGLNQGLNSGNTSAPANYNPGGSYTQTIANLGY